VDTVCRSEWTYYKKEEGGMLAVWLWSGMGEGRGRNEGTYVLGEV
jgi:hypothetical protein